jgi:cyclic pyranopterin phosphate synthase
MEVRMVDISPKGVVRREAVAEGFIRLRAETVARIREGRVEKGDPRAVASLAGVQAVKQTPSMMLLCHPLPIEHVSIDVEVLDEGLRVVCRVVAEAKTGVEMEALAGVAVALLNIWDVVKMYEKDEAGQYPDTAIEWIRVVRKVKG